MRANVFSYFYESRPISVCYSQIRDQLITKFTLTRLCQLSSRVGGSFVLRFFVFFIGLYFCYIFNPILSEVLKGRYILGNYCFWPSFEEGTKSDRE